MTRTSKTVMVIFKKIIECSNLMSYYIIHLRLSKAINVKLVSVKKYPNVAKSKTYSFSLALVK